MSYMSTKMLLGSRFNVSPVLSEIRNCCLFLPYILHPVCFTVRDPSAWANGKVSFFIKYKWAYNMSYSESVDKGLVLSWCVDGEKPT